MCQFQKLKEYNLTIKAVLTVFVIAILISIFNLLSWYKDSIRTRNQIDNINSISDITEIESDDTDLPIEPPEDPENPYWKFIKMPMIDVNFDDLKSLNPETKGWIQVPNTNANYPFVQHKDNTFYLSHSFDQQKNNAGWVFLDYRNDIESIDRNNIIYAHGRVNSVLFGTLKSLLKNGWFDDSNNSVIKVSTEYHNTLWQIFSVYRIETTSDYIVTDFRNDETYNNFLNFIKNRSIYDFNVDLTSEDKILTLSTCYSSTEKLVVHAKLIEIKMK